MISVLLLPVVVINTVLLVVFIVDVFTVLVLSNAVEAAILAWFGSLLSFHLFISFLLHTLHGVVLQTLSKAYCIFM